MRLRFLTLLFLTAAAFPAAAASDKDRISDLERRIDVLDHKQDRLLQLEAGHYNDVIRLLRELKKNSEIPVVSVPAVTSPAPVENMPVPVETVTPPVAETSAPAAAPTEAAAAPVTTLPAVPAEVAVAPATSPAPETAATTETPPAVIVPPAVQAPVDTLPPAPVVVQTAESPAFTSRMSRLESLITLSLVATAGSLFAMALMFKNLRQKEQSLKTAIWKSDMQGLREEVMIGRPHIGVEKNFERLTLLNKGTVAANDVQLSLGPAPGAMKQKVRSVPTIRPGEKVEVELPGAAFEGQVYGGLEYKNAQTGRLYKDQFLMKVDGVTGEIVPIREAV